MNVSGKHITVFGMAKSGLAVAEQLRRRGALVRASDVKPAEEMAGLREQLADLRIEFVPQSPAALEGCEMAVLSPGVPANLSLFDEARARGITVTGDFEVASWYLRGPILGITGSNGKTTSTALAGHILSHSSIPAQTGGNIGIAPAAMIDSSLDGQWNVLELSSFQLELVTTARIRIAVILNITPDHLDRHDTLDNYVNAKARILCRQTAEDFAVLNGADDTVRPLAHRTQAQVRFFHTGMAMERGFSVDGTWLTAGEHPWMRVEEIPLRGRHNVENVLAAACACHLAGAPLESIRDAVVSFPGVEHRLEFVRSVNGVQYYNDSKATNVDATIKALESFDSGIWIILGGKDKNSDYTLLRGLLKARAKAALLIGAAAGKIAGHLGDAVPLIRCGDLAAAVSYARAHAQPGGTVLLSPACASFDQFRNFEHRGQSFKELVAALEDC